MDSKRAWAMCHSGGLGIALLFLVSNGCNGDTYSAVMDKAEAGYSALVTADDRMYRRRLQDALEVNTAFSGLNLSAYVFMDKGYVVGHVERPEQAKDIFQTARNVRGLRSVDAFLPAKDSAPVGGAGPITSDASIKSEIESTLLRAQGVEYSHVHVEVLDGRVVLLGVVAGDQARTRAERITEKTAGVKDVRNWLLVPETDYLTIRSQF
ncbi:hypothetical protein W02_02340 [Nitrospira sp. KM1]|uniref:BON domain-containing protein n=1 Tax=Nitrospira sp. KM1 TaxID=1936990 RepID=UPI0013A73717|nr:BON domain-containing protein [Nitrospira sp. KM1]BCA53094.1 hypothetical protein W02_02340 [Nitrospira sp. KM1]